MESLKEKIKELCSYAKSFREYDNAVSVNPQSPLAIYCRYRALEAALNMARCADCLESMTETTRQFETIEG
jgi:hypothetical protein